MDDWMITVICSRKLSALVCSLLGPVGRSPTCVVDGIGGVEDKDWLLTSDTYGEIPDLDGSVNAGAKQVLSVGVPVDGGARLLVMGGDLLLCDSVVAVVPAHDGAVVGAKGKLDGVGGRPLDVIYGSVDAGVVVSAAARHDVLSRVAEIPQTHGCVMAGGQQQVTLVRIEGEFVYLAGVLVQTGQLDACAIEVVQDDLAIGSGGGNVGVEVAMGPLDVLDGESRALPGMGMVGIVDYGSTQVGVLDNAGVELLDAHRLEDVLAGEDGMGAFAVDVEGLDGQTRLVAGVLRGAGADASRLVSVAGRDGGSSSLVGSVLCRS